MIFPYPGWRYPVHVIYRTTTERIESKGVKSGDRSGHPSKSIALEEFC